MRLFCIEFNCKQVFTKILSFIKDPKKYAQIKEEICPNAIFCPTIISFSPKRIKIGPCLESG